MQNVRSFKKIYLRGKLIFRQLMAKKKQILPTFNKKNNVFMQKLFNLKNTSRKNIQISIISREFRRFSDK